MGNASSIRSCGWTLPNIGEVKQCCDGSALSNPDPSGIGVVYSDWEGRVLGTLSKAVGSTTNYLAKVQAIVDRVEQVIHRGWTTLWIVSDSLATIKAFISSKMPWKFQIKWRNLLTSMQQSASTQYGDMQISRQTLQLREDPELTNLLRNGLRVDRIFLTRIEDPHSEYFHFC
ncbi:hypothetical protein GIB67_033902 [Kingdonia uniflora]|uniref:RNase H type-1 domain-containing protein n=1 Tax=Kingdonia uniflora TaxID=39325 RepID=A0A7J7NBZ7_9MAGN|nr:hypothetical protein GIB67_033902 [Kingdonia uniflora]